MPNFEDLFPSSIGKKINNPFEFPIPQTKAQFRQARHTCAELGHRYQVVGKKSPERLKCMRCLDTWAIGARTNAEEPSV